MRAKSQGNAKGNLYVATEPVYS